LGVFHIFPRFSAVVGDPLAVLGSSSSLPLGRCSDRRAGAAITGTYPDALDTE
jgi:hypothetical protein